LQQITQVQEEQAKSEELLSYQAFLFLRQGNRLEQENPAIDLMMKNSHFAQNEFFSLQHKIDILQLVLRGDFLN
jgi:hypothetical protein